MLFSKFFKSDPPKQRNIRSKTERTKRTRKQNVRINVSDLRVGMFVVQLDKPWEESSFMLQGLMIKSPGDVLAVQNECQHVWVDYDEMNLGKPNPASLSPITHTLGFGSTLSSKTSVKDEINEAAEAHDLAHLTITNLFEEIRLGSEINGAKVKQAVNGCVDSILRNPDASVWLTRIQTKNQATAQHSLNVTAFSIILAKSIGMSSRELENVGVCGMLHDVGKTRVSSEVLEKKGILNEQEMQEMRKHTRYGQDILLSTKSVMSGAADVAHSHHERPDGKGYPRRLQDDNIPVYAKIVAIAEAYDTMTINQTYRQAIPPSDAMQELYAMRGTQFEEELVISFIEAIGVFPPGSIVEMRNGEIGIVLSNTTHKLRPKVIIILDSFGEPTSQRIIDLSQMEVDSEARIYEIKAAHSDGSFGIDIGEFQRAGLRMG